MAQSGVDQIEDAALLAESPERRSGAFVASLGSSSESGLSSSDEDSSEDLNAREGCDGFDRLRSSSFALSTPPESLPGDAEDPEEDYASAVSARSSLRSARSAAGSTSSRHRPKKRSSIMSQYALLDRRHSINDHLAVKVEDGSIDAQYAMLDRRHSINEELSRPSSVEQYSLLDHRQSMNVGVVMAAENESIDAQYAILDRRHSIIQELSRPSAVEQCSLLDRGKSINDGVVVGDEDGSIDAQYAILDHRRSVMEQLSRPPTVEQFQLSLPAEAIDDQHGSADAICSQYAMLNHRHSIMQNLKAHSGHADKPAESEFVSKADVFQALSGVECVDPGQRLVNDIHGEYAALNSRDSITTRTSAHHVSMPQFRAPDSLRNAQESQFKSMIRASVKNSYEALDPEAHAGSHFSKDSQASSSGSGLCTPDSRESSPSPRSTEVAAVVIRSILARVVSTLSRSAGSSESEFEVRMLLRFLYTRLSAVNGEQIPIAEPCKNASMGSLLDAVAAAEEVPWLPTVYGRVSCRLPRTISDRSDSFELLDESSSPSCSSGSLTGSPISFEHANGNVPRAHSSEDLGKAHLSEDMVHANEDSSPDMGQAFAKFGTSVYEGLLSFFPPEVGSGDNVESPRFRISTDEIFRHFPSGEPMEETYSQQIVNDGPQRYLWPIEEEELDTDEEEGQTLQRLGSRKTGSPRNSLSSGGLESSHSSPVKVGEDRAMQDTSGGYDMESLKTGEGDSRQPIEPSSSSSASTDNICGLRRASDESTSSRQHLEPGDDARWTRPRTRRSSDRSRTSRSSFDCDPDALLSDRHGRSRLDHDRQAAGQGAWSTRIFSLIMGDLSMCCQCKGRQGR